MRDGMEIHSSLFTLHWSPSTQKLLCISASDNQLSSTSLETSALSLRELKASYTSSLRELKVSYTSSLRELKLLERTELEGA